MQLRSVVSRIVFLALLCGLFTTLTMDEQQPMDANAAEALAERIHSEFGQDAFVLVLGRSTNEEKAFSEKLEETLQASGLTVRMVLGQPTDARRVMVELVESEQLPDVIGVNGRTAKTWALLKDLTSIDPSYAKVVILKPESYNWPNFLKKENITNIANQIAVIAIIAVGMTFVIIGGGIDLSVGSLIALGSVVAAVLIRDQAGGFEASILAMTICSLIGILVCALVGAFSGTMVVWLDIPPFIVTLAMMLVASGLAFILSSGNSIPELPEAYTLLGRGALLSVPNPVLLLQGRIEFVPIRNPVLLMLVTYTIAYLVLSFSVLGRYVYAVGGNREAAFLSGVPVKRVLFLTYVLAGLLAGVGGIVFASEFQSGDPRYGIMYELYVIAAVVVGGTSLTGGRGTVLGTLVGALLIGVINNGMNLLHVESYVQKVILGLVILGAVLLDRITPRR